MIMIWLGALLLIAGLLFMIAQPLRRGRLSDRHRTAATAAPTLEPREPAVGFSLASNWPGLALAGLGALLLIFSGLWL